MSAEKLYVIVRGDLVPGAQAVQAMHAARQFAEDHRERESRWFKESNHLALLSVPGEKELLTLEREARFRGFLSSRFEEPDFGMRVTAIALAPEARRLCSRLPKALMT